MNLSEPEIQIAGEVLNQDERVEHLAELFRSLADPSRIKILSLLLEGEKNVVSLAEAVGISEPGVSHHLRGLRLMHIVRGRRQGREVYYTLDDDHVAALLRMGWEHIRHA
jgi:ArsR family transcriptional regulator